MPRKNREWKAIFKIESYGNYRVHAPTRDLALAKAVELLGEELLPYAEVHRPKIMGVMALRETQDELARSCETEE